MLGEGSEDQPENFGDSDGTRIILAEGCPP